MRERSSLQARLAANPLLSTLLGASFAACLLQLWRPYFFLTCDTLSGTLPVSTEAYRRLWEGHSPFFNPYLFGGYDLRNDLGHFTLWSPLALPFSFLAKTPYYYVLPDVVGTLSLVVIAGAFCWSGLRIRRSLDLSISPALIVALSLSYAFTPYNFIVGASWIGFLNVQAAYPLLLAGALEKDWRRGLAIQATALLYAIFGGHMHLFTMLLIFGGSTVLLVAIMQRRSRPILVWVGAGLLTLLLILPLLWPSLVGFSHSSRSAGLSAATASRDNVAFHELAASFLLGPFCQPLIGGISIDLSDPVYNTALAFTLVNVPLIGMLAWKRRWNTLEIGLAGLMLVAVAFIARPLWLGEIFAHLPLLRSLRWPFREIVALHFLTHTLFLVGYRPPVAGMAARRAALACGVFGVTAFALVFLCTAPTFWLFEPDRRLIISGEADRYWNQLKEKNGITPGHPRFAIQAQPETLMPLRPVVPFVLMGGFNYASLFRISNVTGFSTIPPRNALWLESELGVRAWFWGGIYSKRAVDRITTAHPDVQRIALTRMQPATWRVFDNTPQAREFHVEWPAGQVVEQSLTFQPSQPTSMAPR